MTFLSLPMICCLSIEVENAVFWKDPPRPPPKLWIKDFMMRRDESLELLISFDFPGCIHIMYYFHQVMTDRSKRVLIPDNVW